MTIVDTAPVTAVGDDIARILGPVLDPALAELAGALGTVVTLSAAEREAVHSGLARSLRDVVWEHVSRTVVLELHIARRAGRLTAADARARWREWVDHLARPAGWDELATPYPVLRYRLEAVVWNRCAAALRLARRFGTDRAALAGLPWGGLGELTEVEFGAGDSHCGGQTTTMLRGSGGRLVYKPRSLAVDAALGALLARVLPDAPTIRVPAVLPHQGAHGGYGWAEHVAHRHCHDDAELTAFYRGLGHWLAVLRLLAGTDLHAENLIAAGPVPVVVDCETLFAPVALPRPQPATPSGYGDAVDRAGDLLDRSVLGTGLLPGRGAGPGVRGLDMSGAGALPGQQPVLRVPGLVDQGTDHVRMGMVELRPPGRRNLPSPEPDLVRYWECVEHGYLALTEHLRRLDRHGRLEGWLADFADCPMRTVCRDTAGYAEIGHMLWHPSSLHRPEAAAKRASELLARQAENRASAPSEPDVIAAEVAELLDGDIPVFTTTPRSGVLAGPRGTRRGQPADLLAAALTRWRSADPAFDRRIIRSTVVSAYLNDGAWQPPLPAPTRIATGDLDRRRRALAAGIIGRLGAEAIRGRDGTVTWMAPAYGATGWSVRPIPPDLYSGLIGVAVALAGYRVETAAGRADPVPEVESLLAGTLATLRLAEDRLAADLAQADAAGIAIRPESPGGFTGLGSRIWGWLLLHRLGAVDAVEAQHRAEMLAGRIASSIDADETYDLLSGAAGAVVPLLTLADRTGNNRWRALARRAADRLLTVSTVDDSGARWPTGQFPRGLGGLAHGAAGIGWALARLAASEPDQVGMRELAGAAFRWQETLYHPDRPGWRDLRQHDRVTFTEAWCHGAVGIGLIAADLLVRDPDPHWPDLVARAAAVTWLTGRGHDHSLCHGSLSAWELLDVAARGGLARPEVTPRRVAAEIVTSIEAHGPVTGMARGVFQPGLVFGAGGVAYQLLRSHPECELPSVLLPDPG